MGVYAGYDLIESKADNFKTDFSFDYCRADFIIDRKDAILAQLQKQKM
jgi:hypothetical protein